MEIWSGCRDLNSGPFAPQATNINHLQTALTENKRLAVARFARQMDARTPGWGGLDSTRTPESPLAVHVSGHRPISEWRVIREKLPDALILARHLVPPSGRRLIPHDLGSAGGLTEEVKQARLSRMSGPSAARYFVASRSSVLSQSQPG